MLRKLLLGLAMMLLVSAGTCFADEQGDALPVESAVGQTDLHATAQEMRAKVKDLRAKAKEENKKCFSCHGKEGLQWKTQHGSTLDLFISPSFYGRSLHAGVSCQNCHEGVDEKAFDEAPHRFKEKQAKDCMACHDKAFVDINAQFQNSFHVKELAKRNQQYRCSYCHDPHIMKKAEQIADMKWNIGLCNYKCLKCHTDKSGFERLSGKRMLDQDLSHRMMLNKNLHYDSVRCVDCHAAGQGTRIHEIMPKDKSLRDCGVCHQGRSALVTTLYVTRDEHRAWSMLGKGLFDETDLLKHYGPPAASAQILPDSPYGFMNADFLKGMYVIGSTRDRALDGDFMAVLLVLLGLVVLHGALRLALRRVVHPAEGGEAVNLYPVTIRLWHWVNAVLLLVLLVSGLLMHYCGGAGAADLGTLDTMHKYTGLILVVWLAGFVLCTLFTGGVRQYWPFGRGFFRRVAAQGAFYAWGIFRGRPHPEQPTAERRLNVLQQMTYLLVMYVCLPLAVLSGLTLFAPEALPKMLFGPNGRNIAVRLHMITAWLCLLFLIGHAYLATTGEHGPLELIKGMLTGRRKRN